MAVGTIIILSIVAIIAALLIFYKKQFKFWKDLGFVHTKPSFPFGDASGVGSSRSIGFVVNDVYKKFPDERFVGFWMFFSPTLLVRDPGLIKTIFVKDFMTFHDRGLYVNEKVDPLSGHLFSLSGTKWRNIRVKLTPTFTSGKMKMMYPILVECSKELKKLLDVHAEKEEVIEVKDIVARFTTDIISLCAFGIESNCLQDPDSEFRYFGQKILEPSVRNTVRGMLQTFLPTLSSIFSIRTLDKECTEFFMNAVRDTVDYRVKNNIRRNDFMDLLIQLMRKGQLDDVDGEKDETKNMKFSFDEAAAQAFIFFIAGYETSSTTMQFALYELAKNPEIQKRTRDEIRKVMIKHDNELTYECVLEMEYLERVINETLRIYSPVPFLQRECNKDYQIPDTDLILPKGTQVLIDLIGLHNDPVHFPSPNKFDPDRFTEEESAKRHNYAFLPFGEGPRNCIGMRFGMMQTKIGMVTLLTNFEFNVAKETPIPMVMDAKSFIQTPLAGMNLRISRLKQKT